MKFFKATLLVYLVHFSRYVHGFAFAPSFQTSLNGPIVSSPKSNAPRNDLTRLYSWTPPETGKPSGRNLSMPEINVDVESIKSSLENISNSLQGNFQEGDFGERGEQYVIAQGFLIVCILGGGVPLVGGALQFIFGPVLLAAGLLVAASAVLEIEDGLTPFPKTISKSTLRTDNVYGYVRHPMYSGLLATMMGYSIMTDSASRVLLTLVLYCVLYAKSVYEEQDLIESLQGYQAYKKAVRGRFLPVEWTDTIMTSFGSMPSMKGNDKN